MLRDVGTRAIGDRLRLYQPDKALLFSNLDARRPGYRRAVQLARDAGYEPVTRLAGGHAAVFLEASVAFAWATADREASMHIPNRFELFSGWVAAALRSLGLDARVGEVEGEYCPGEYSVNVEGRVKVMGVGQRVIRGAAHVGGVITVGQTVALQETLIPVYDALDLEFHPPSAGGLADFDPNITPAHVIEAMIGVIGPEYREVHESTFDSSLLSAAQALTPLHSAERSPSAGSVLRPTLQTSGAKTLVQGDDWPSTVDDVDNANGSPD